MLKDMALDELRAARAMTQAELGHKLGLKQAAMSRMERRTDVYVSIRVVFRDGTVRISQSSDGAGGSAKGQVAAAVTACVGGEESTALTARGRYSHNAETADGAAPRQARKRTRRCTADRGKESGAGAQ